MMINFMTLSEVCINIVDCPHESPKWLREGIPVIRNFNLIDGQIDLSDDYYVDEETYNKRIRRAIPSEGDIIFSREAPIGNCAVIPHGLKCCLGQRLVLLKVNKKICSPEYLLTVLLSDYVKKQIDQVSRRGSIVSNFNISELGNLSVPIIDNQKEISDFATLLSKKITNNKAINMELELIAKTIYDYWFLQFNFPNESGKPYKSSGGKMVWNDEMKKEIPEGWEVKKVQDILAKIPTTKKYKFDEYGKGNKYPIIDQSSKYICGYTDDESELLNLEDCIVFGDHTKYVKYVNFAFARGADGTQVINSSIRNLPNYILYRQILDMDLVSQGYSRYFKFLKDKYVIVPLKNVSDNFMEGINGSLSKMKHIINENKELESLRNFLLPLLMNGQVGFK